MQDDSGFILVNKPRNITSSSIVLKVKKLINTKKIGHTGTLDKFADGLLVLPLGDCTSFSSLFLEMKKSYFVNVLFGKKTDSGDIDGEIESEWDFTQVNSFFEKNSSEVLQKILDIKNLEVQTPPKLSALKINGKRQAELFRQGIEFESKPRKIQIFEIFVEDLTERGFSMKTTVSSGTYIRKLILDLSDSLGLPMHISKLTRTKVGDLSLNDANTLEQIESGNFSIKRFEEILKLPFVTVDEKTEVIVKHGGYARFPEVLENEFGFLLKNLQGQIIAWCNYKNRKKHLPYFYHKVF